MVGGRMGSSQGNTEVGGAAGSWPVRGSVDGSNPEDDWMENIDVCENCHYPIVPLDSKISLPIRNGSEVRDPLVTYEGSGRIHACSRAPKAAARRPYGSDS